MTRPNGIAAPTKVRDGRGRFTRNPNTAERDGQAAFLRAQGLTYRAIATRLGVDVASAYQAVQRALRDSVTEGGEQARQIELDRLDQLQMRALAIVAREHPVVSHGRIIKDEGRNVRDPGPELAAIRTLLAISERRAKLLGLDAATKVDVSGGVTVELVGVDPDDI